MSTKITYTCAKCGKPAIFGEHFCDDRDIARNLESANRPQARRPLFSARFFSAKPSARKIWPVVAGGATLAVLLFIFYKFLGPFGLVFGVAGLALLAMIFKGSAFFTSASRYEERLLQLCHGNQELARRLTHVEMAKRPDLSEKEAVRRAIDRLYYDRSR